MVNGIDLQRAKYDPSEFFINSDKSEYGADEDEDNDPKQPTTLQGEKKQEDLAPTFQSSALDPDLENLCTTCVASKSTRTVKRHKSMTPTNEKLDEVHADLWGPHDPPSRPGKVYAAILMCECTRKTWSLYLCTKDEFVDAFQSATKSKRSE